MGYDLYSTSVTITDAEHEKITDRVLKDFGPNDSPISAIQAVWDALAETGGYFRFDNIGWRKALQLAHEHGWQPEHDADDYYINCDHQEISAKDAAGMAAALESSLEALRGLTPFQSAATTTGIGEGMFVHHNRDDLSPEAFWACAPDKIERFIAFARRGAFTVH